MSAYTSVLCFVTTGFQSMSYVKPHPTVAQYLSVHMGFMLYRNYRVMGERGFDIKFVVRTLLFGEFRRCFATALLTSSYRCLHGHWHVCKPHHRPLAPEHLLGHLRRILFVLPRLFGYVGTADSSEQSAWPFSLCSAHRRTSSTRSSSGRSAPWPRD
jgi:hypothetical protein